MGNMVADAMRLKYPGVDAAYTNSGGLRADLNFTPPTAGEQPGEITWGEMFSVLPFGNRTVIETLTGAQLEQAFVNGFTPFCFPAFTGGTGRFPQVSGLRFEYDASRKPGSRITSLTVSGKPLDDKRMYTLATTSYVALDAGDGYDMFRQAPLLVPLAQAPLETDMLLQAIAAVPAIAPQVEGRIKRVDVGKDQSSCNQARE